MTNKGKVFAGLVFAMTAFAQSESTFEVKEIDADTVKNLSESEAKVEAAAKTLTEAQTIMSEAKTRRDAIVESVKAKYGAYNGTCVYPNYIGTGGLYNGTRKYRTVEVRGKYALISESTSQCPPWGITTSLDTIDNKTYTVERHGPPEAATKKPKSPNVQ